MYDPNAIQYYQTLFDNAVKILKAQLLLRLHYTQHYIKTSKKNNTNSNQMYIKKNILNSANYSSTI